MPYYIQYDKKGQQESALFSDEQPKESGWHLAPKAYDGSRLCVLVDTGSRLLSDTEIAASEQQQQRTQANQETTRLADGIRHELVAGTSAIKREGYQIKAGISQMYRIETALKAAKALPANQTLLNAYEVAAIQAEIKERGFNEIPEQLLKIWEKRAGEYAVPACNIGGVETRLQADIKAATPERLAELSRNLPTIAAKKRQAFKAQQAENAPAVATATTRKGGK